MIIINSKMKSSAAILNKGKPKQQDSFSGYGNKTVLVFYSLLFYYFYSLSSCFVKTIFPLYLGFLVNRSKAIAG
jgi:hypothetical protein